MALPPGFLDELRTRTSLTQVVGRKVMWDNRKSNPGKGDMWAPCPFHQEKSASFHVDDRKGFYYCFGCHAKGDAISFVRDTENVEFMEAIRILASEAGMQIPERDPQAQAKADRRTQLAEVMHSAQQHFRLMLKTGAGSDARAYLERRGLDEATQEKFGIGFAPQAWQGLWDHLTGKGVKADLIFGCGLARPSQKGGTPYDVFRGRIMFPIHDVRGRVIAFGGRAMDPNDNAKYLNSPETELFDKSLTLYNYGPAREAAGKGQPLIVAEGYMDVIALSQAGFGAAVAPLGTAVTEAQLGLMWRAADEPIMALDGDRAGLAAARRVIDLALPLLEAGKSLRFALMPEGQDPDDILRAQGAGAVQAILDAAQPMVRLLWQRETEGRDFDSPERRAALDKALFSATNLIRDPSIKGHYESAIKELKWEMFSARKRADGGTRQTRRADGGRWAKPDMSARASTKSSPLARSDPRQHDHMREAVILASIIATPAIAEEFETALDRLDCFDAQHAQLRDLIVQHAGEGPEALHGAITEALGAAALEKLASLPHVALAPPVRNPGNQSLAQMTVAEELAKIAATRGLQAEIVDAAEDMMGVADEAVTWRLGQAAEARNRAVRSEHEDRAEYDVAENGARLNRGEREEFDALLDRITFSKPRR
ncbi:DNA primase [Roseovarius nanhaiticus]|uniref:DNA primase n=1 Tax=Roseovarius nanhaiticus TaxID=573024 RepID=A0A1N7FHC3_9RHOB|nr:DNA primase [Roseovarius nanhaiticus]SEK54308.1 DNA primase [Roseovarius nanhaiticus]SIR99828.1 DNA primase [Roseovarius nanhaiticus]